ncbi:RNA-binding protein, putative [Plasmodium chabaudi chabaudi]|uniref:RNA-binding protein, putative n=2 Tax=Plasmodium chabaudi TaxID=5825 RepID=A0A077TNZ6_PLACU|nr:single-strand telomeric DNA-binding protein GBP2, putative [Plasmodium chabaudi chabaudi]SCM22966.1 RNA-binding protein, putative [Plasmodium chabaudi adami]SCM24310.1 RNA-binding protein, putative [Plasmodium chabaudi chabaudi]SCN61762.1 RNA-binding protein, putative [Plasmodium chabaudi adami]SCN61763.1 RNA-binding protein, putative [Plasmodium chabaudi chabaudi]VTZ69528.1 single-strand telomeric DNA-binding protein GBP2, putative [Plasmodium chabaudi chabaudi]|eukprot:XP_016654167.1 RNA-binding protein, putative [Plasmodium chabaudi chabaudi]
MEDSQNSPAKGCRVYVGNLPWKVTWPILKAHMKKAGEVVRVDIFEDAQGRSKGCGIVEYSTCEEAQEAISSLNDSKLEDRLIFVREDREENSGSFEKRRFSNVRKDKFYDSRRRRDFDYRRDFRRDDYRRDFRRDNRKDDYRKGGDFRRGGRRNCTLVVYNLPPQSTWKELKDLFKKHGRVVRADLKNDDNSSKEVTGTVIMESDYDAKNAIDALNFCNFDGYILKVNYEHNE